MKKEDTKPVDTSDQLDADIVNIFRSNINATEVVAIKQLIQKECNKAVIRELQDILREAELIDMGGSMGEVVDSGEVGSRLAEKKSK